MNKLCICYWFWTYDWHMTGTLMLVLVFCLLVDVHSSSRPQGLITSPRDWPRPVLVLVLALQRSLRQSLKVESPQYKWSEVIENAFFSLFRTLRIRHLRKWGQYYYILLFSPLSPFYWPQNTWPCVTLNGLNGHFTLHVHYYELPLAHYLLHI